VFPTCVDRPGNRRGRQRTTARGPLAWVVTDHVKARKLKQILPVFQPLAFCNFFAPLEGFKRYKRGKTTKNLCNCSLVSSGGNNEKGKRKRKKTVKEVKRKYTAFLHFFFFCCWVFTYFLALDKVGDVHGHLLDLGVVELLDLAEHGNVLTADKVDGNTLATETTATTNATIKEEREREG